MEWVREMVEIASDMSDAKTPDSTKLLGDGNIAEAVVGLQSFVDIEVGCWFGGGVEEEEEACELRVGNEGFGKDLVEYSKVSKDSTPSSFLLVDLMYKCRA